jgi:hypothetical protein
MTSHKAPHHTVVSFVVVETCSIFSVEEQVEQENGVKESNKQNQDGGDRLLRNVG